MVALLPAGALKEVGGGGGGVGWMFQSLDTAHRRGGGVLLVNNSASVGN